MTQTLVAVIENEASAAVVQGWRRTRLGYEVWLRARLGWKGLKADEYVLEGYALLSTPDIKGRQINFANVNYISKARFDESPEIKVNLGDVLLAKDGSTLGTVNVIRELPIEATVNSSIAVLTPYSGLNSEFLSYSLQGTVLKSLIQELKGGMGVPHLFQDDIKMFPLLLPSLEEQSAIASFLDRETAQIDVLIAKQQQLIETLAERRKAVITRAVTRGLDPTVELKDSAVREIGYIPKHWSVKKLSRLFQTIGSGTTPPTEGTDFYDGETPWVTTGELRESVIYETSKFVSKFALSSLSALRIYPEGSLVLAMYGATIGRLGILGVAATTNQACCVMADASDANVKFIYYALQISKERLLTLSSGGGQPNINQDIVRQFRVAVPPMSQQVGIVTFLEHETRKLDALGAKASQFVDVLKERRQALISAAVTGKIDVREKGL